MLSGQATGLAKSGDGAVETIRMFKIAKDSAVKARTQAINQLKAVLVRADPALRESLSGLGRVALIRRCAALPPTTDHSTHAATIAVLRSLARRVLALTDETRTLEQQMSSAIAACAPQLLDQYGVGPDTAAALLITAGDNPDRLTNQAAFAALCGVNPIEASSGKTTRRRLNRGGDRRANSALYTIVLTRLGRDQRTRDYATKRTAEGKSTKETIRCLKRYVTRQIFPSSPQPCHQPQRPTRRLDKHRGVITLHRQLRVLPPQPRQLRPLVLRQLPGSGLTASLAVLLHPVGKGPVVDPRVTGDLGDRLTRLAHDAHRARPELRIELASRLSHEPLSLKLWPPRYEGNGIETPVAEDQLGRSWSGLPVARRKAPRVRPGAPDRTAVPTRLRHYVTCSASSRRRSGRRPDRCRIRSRTRRRPAGA